MSKLIVNNIDSRSTSTEFKDIITANHKKQWLDTYGVIKAFKNTIDENIINFYVINLVDYNKQEVKSFLILDSLCKNLYKSGHTSSIYQTPVVIHLN